MSIEEQTNTISEQQVFDYLASHPDFLQQYPQLLSHIEVPHDVDGGVSLVERQVKVLREKNRELQGKLIEMLKAAQDNEALLQKCIRLVLCLVDCTSLEQLTNTLEDVVKREFDLDAATIHLIGRWPKVSSVRVYSTADKLQSILECRFPDDEPICGRLDRRVKEAVFPNHSFSSGSVALLPIGKGGHFGVLALYSRDQTRFSPEMGSLFLELISAVTSQMLQKFKDF